MSQKEQQQAAPARTLQSRRLSSKASANQERKPNRTARSLKSNKPSISLKKSSSPEKAIDKKKNKAKEPVKASANKPKFSFGFGKNKTEKPQKEDKVSKKATKKQSKAAKKETKKKKKTKKETVHYANELIPIKEIKNGIIRTTDNRYVRAIEVFPVNFEQKTQRERDNILINFQRIFTICPTKIMFYTTNSKTDVTGLINVAKQITYTSQNDKLVREMHDYIKQINNIKDVAGITTKYYIIFEYDPSLIEDEGDKYNFNTIYNIMMNTEFNIRDILRSCGNATRSFSQSDVELDELNQIRIIYEFYNRKTRYEYDLESFVRRMEADEYKYNNHVKKSKKYQLVDYVSPRGIDTTNKDLILMDGIWFTFLGIKDNAYPPYVSGAWLNGFSYDAGVDVVVQCKKQPHEVVSYFTSKRGLLASTTATYTGDREKAERQFAIAQNSRYITQKLKEGEELFKVSIIFIIWGEDPLEVYRIRNAISDGLKSYQIKTEKSRYDCDKFLKATSPLMSYDAGISRRLGHDFLSSSLSACYNYTKYSLFDNNGFVIGSNMQNGSILAMDNFNTREFKNANMAIVGTTGSGKTYLEMLIARRSRFIGINTYFVLPVKGNEYYRFVQSIGGEIALLHPNSKTCINVMAIYPEVYFDEDSIEDDVQLGQYNQSYLSKKITSLVTWMQLRLGNSRILSDADVSALRKLLTVVYNDYGINEDNNSIYDAYGNIKEMPTLRTLYDHAKEDTDTYGYVVDSLQEFIFGDFKNFVGQTNIDLNNPCIVFDVDERAVSERYLPSVMYIAYDCAYSLAISNQANSDIFLDEAWKMMVNEDCAKQIAFMSRLIRGYGGSLIVATQELTDFMKTGEGETILNNSKIKILLGLEHGQLMKISELMGLDEDEIGLIESFQRGQGMLIANNLHIPMNIIGSERETYIFSPLKKSKTRN